MEKMVDSVDKVVKYLGETFKNSKVVDFILKGHVPSRKGSAAEIPEEVRSSSCSRLQDLHFFHSNNISLVHIIPTALPPFVFYIRG